MVQRAARGSQIVAAAPSSGAVMLHVVARYYRDEAWVLAFAANLRGVFTQGRTIREARANLLDALYLMAEDQVGLQSILTKPPSRIPRGLSLIEEETFLAALRPR